MTISVSRLALARLARHRLEHRDAVGVGQVAIEDHEIGRLALPGGEARLRRSTRVVTANPSADSASSATMRNVFSSSMTSTVGFMRHAPPVARLRGGALGLAASSGSRTRNSAPPSSGEVATSIAPPCASTKRREVGSPSPVPFGLVVKNGSNRCARASARQARAVVGDLDDAPRRRAPPTVTGDVLPRFDRVLDQVHDHALDLVRVAARPAASAARSRVSATPRSATRSASSSRRARDHRRQIGRRALDARRARERQQRIDHVAQARDLAHHLRAQPRHPRRRWRDPGR